jgi:hypothetical protein
MPLNVLPLAPATCDFTEYRTEFCGYFVVNLSALFTAIADRDTLPGACCSAIGI